MRDHVLMGITTGARTAAALGTLLILAKTLGPSDFGFVSVVITWSTIVALVTDYGFGMRALRDIGAERGRAGEIMSASLAAKTLMVVPACLVLVPLTLFWFDLQPHERIAALLFLIGTLANSYGDLALVVFRSIGQFHRETRIVVATALLHFALIGLAIYLQNDLIAIGIAFLVSRLIYAAFAVGALSRLLELGGILRQSWRALGERFKVSASFALDSGATNIFAQLDVILVNHIAGREAAGIYYAGSRLLQGAVPFTVLLASVHIPRYAHRLHNNASGLLRYGIRILGEFMLLGIVFSIGFYVFGPLYTDHFLGSAYEQLNALWLGFACFTAARFLTAALGVQLMAFGAGYLRTLGIVVSGVVTLTCYWIFIPSHGIQAVPWVATFGMVVLGSIYGLALTRIFRNRAAGSISPVDAHRDARATRSLKEPQV
ncbi:lipopolysaccharide biosynthesis protein [Stutzerimonas tarimensis]|uniref:Lipopolysaccharide biosynthesis protein n=1 Tax=Stutzerimonas tarimensis TaxID=1507735 RepID=A0ABV7T465_9GAMM